MGKRPSKARSNAIQQGKAPMPPRGGGGVSQRQSAGRNSISIQSGRDINVSISASNNSVVAWNINGEVNIGRPPPPPIDWDAAVEVERGFPWVIYLLGLLVVNAMTAVILIAVGMNPVAAVGGVAIGAILYNGTYWAAKRRTRPLPAPVVEPPTTVEAPKTPKPKPTSHWETRPFVAVCACPNCGEIALHGIRPSSPEGAKEAAAAARTLKGVEELAEDQIAYIEGLLNGGDPADADVIRVCAQCKQEWGEK